MAKQKRLNKGQKRRIQQNREKRLAQEIDVPSDQLGASETGIIVSRYGQHADLLTSENEIVRCHIRRTVDSLVTGDKVQWRPMLQSQDGMRGIIEAMHERESLLSRPDYYDGLKPVAANIDQIFVISSVLPSFTTQIIDRYIVACEAIDIEPIIVLNKADLLTEIDADERALIEQRLADYRAIGYQVLWVSSKTADGMAELNSMLSEHISIVVGQSGVGKSSIVNQLLPEVATETKEVSTNSGLGQHTTTVATWYPLKSGGALIDSPGIREFALWHLEPEQVASGYIDFQPYLGACKFKDCKHKNDPGCALQEAVEQGEILPWRLENYHRIIESMMANKPSRVSARGKL